MYSQKVTLLFVEVDYSHDEVAATCSPHGNSSKVFLFVHRRHAGRYWQASLLPDRPAVDQHPRVREPGVAQEKGQIMTQLAGLPVAVGDDRGRHFQVGGDGHEV